MQGFPLVGLVQCQHARTCATWIVHRYEQEKTLDARCRCHRLIDSQRQISEAFIRQGDAGDAELRKQQKYKGGTSIGRESDEWTVYCFRPRRPWTVAVSADRLSNFMPVHAVLRTLSPVPSWQRSRQKMFPGIIRR